MTRTAHWILLLALTSGVGYAAPAEAPAEPAEAEPVEAAPDEAPATADTPAIKPRFELLVPSVGKLLSEARRSHSGPFVRYLGDVFLEMSEASSEGVDRAALLGAAERIKGWPDTSLVLMTFAPDREGRTRWAVRLDWSLADLRKRLDGLLAEESVAEVVEGVRLVPHDDGGFALTLKGDALGHFLAEGQTRSLIVSHRDLPVPGEVFGGEGSEEIKSLAAARLHFTPTEKDSGATFFSSFSVVTALDYSAAVVEDGNWSEVVRVHWPPISGMGLKAFIGSVKQTFVVPEEAFGAIVFNTMGLPAMLDAMAGFGPEMVFDESGQMTMLGESAIGPLAAHGESEACIVVLPGTGFLPAPDVVFQTRIRKPDEMIEHVRKATKRTNELYRERERREPWHEAWVRGRPVFWREGGRQVRAVMMPLVMSPVVFTTSETDAKGRERDFAVVALTSTSPEAFVQRWLDLPRRAPENADAAGPPTHLPVERKSDGQAWINWKLVYDWLHPYFDVGLSVISKSALLPATESIAADLTHAMITADMSYFGLSVTHRGPLPVGAAVLPAMIGTSVEPDRRGGSDLARERLACQRLRVLYHHSTLFKKDIGRWPAEVRELDGYVDFAGNPGLLRLQLSPIKQWSDWFTGLFETDDEEEAEEDPDETDDGLDTDLYVIDWGREDWSLGFAPDTFEHLEKLYIDHNGQIHRLERKPPEDKPEAPASEGDNTEPEQPQPDADDAKEDES